MPLPDTVLVAYSTCPDELCAEHIARTLVDERLAACVNRLPGARSTYFWDGRLQDEAEILLIIKTTAGRLSELTARLKALHPYQTPELIAAPVLGGNEQYLEWVRMSVKTQDESRE